MQVPYPELERLRDPTPAVVSAIEDATAEPLVFVMVGVLPERMISACCPMPADFLAESHLPVVSLHRTPLNTPSGPLRVLSRTEVRRNPALRQGRSSRR